jgi:hypothetical protein
VHAPSLSSVASACPQFAPIRGSAAALVGAAVPVAAPASPAASSGPMATKVDVGPTAFPGVLDAAHVEGLRVFYADNAPEKLGQVLCRGGQVAASG